jgi:hypothetical protein
LGYAIAAGAPLLPIAYILGYILGEGGLTIVRPALILFALLRFQFFGHELKAERYIIYLTTIMMAFFGGLFISFFFYWLPPPTVASIIVGVCLVLLFPSYLAAGKLIERVIPSIRKMTRKEAREVYFMTFHSAIFKGEITDRRDDEALEDLRKRLKISDREHTLLLQSERMRVVEWKPVNQIRYVIFVQDTGTHVASVGPMGDKDEAVLAGMLTAVRSFVKDAFGSSTGDLDTIQYGNQKLLMEWERGFILAVDLQGEIDPASRVIVGDLLAILMRRHWKVLRLWEGDLADVKPIQADLERLVIRYNKSGSF